MDNDPVGNKQFNRLMPRMFSNLQEEMTSRVREGRRRKKAKNGDYEDELNSGDCEVFQCGAASLGHMAFRLLKIIFESPPNC